MTNDEFLSLIRTPEKVNSGHVADLKELITYYPYFSQARILLAKAALEAKNLHATSYVDHAALYCSDRRWLYYYLYPDRKISNELFKMDRVPKYSGNYFDLINTVESDGGDSKQSLKNLAERLKAARAMVTPELVKNVNQSVAHTVKPAQVRVLTPDYFPINNEEGDKISEDYVKKLIRDKKYDEAIVILKKLNLINPKKSIYFADQIRFLEKVIVNSKK